GNFAPCTATFVANYSSSCDHSLQVAVAGGSEGGASMPASENGQVVLGVTGQPGQAYAVLIDGEQVAAGTLSASVEDPNCAAAVIVNAGELPCPSPTPSPTPSVTVTPTPTPPLPSPTPTPTGTPIVNPSPVGPPELPPGGTPAPPNKTVEGGEKGVVI